MIKLIYQNLMINHVLVLIKTEVQDFGSPRPGPDELASWEGSLKLLILYKFMSESRWQ